MILRIGIVGSRRRDTDADLALTRQALSIFPKVDLIVSGGCPRGGDRFAEILAAERNIETLIFKADWKLGRHAGFLRNGDIADNSDILIAVVAPDRTGGTEDTIKKFLKKHATNKLILV